MAEYKISIPHFYCLEYYEENKKMTIDIDFRETTIYLNKSLLKRWDSPNDNVYISEKHKEKIINNIYKELLKNNSSSRVIMEKEK